jgi:hypothetical protein
MLVHPDSRAAIQAALETLDDAIVDRWQSQLQPPPVGPALARWFSRATRHPDALQLPEWARALLKNEEIHAQISFWIVALSDENPRTAIRLNKRFGPDFVSTARKVELPHSAKHMCKRIFSRVGEDPSIRGRAIILLGCGARWRRAVVNHGYNELANVVCRSQFSASSPAVKTGLLKLSKEFEW